LVKRRQLRTVSGKQSLEDGAAAVKSRFARRLCVLRITYRQFRSCCSLHRRRDYHCRKYTYSSDKYEGAVLLLVDSVHQAIHARCTSSDVSIVCTTCMTTYIPSSQPTCIALPHKIRQYPLTSPQRRRINKHKHPTSNDATS